MTEKYNIEDLKLVGRRRKYFPGRLACWLFMWGFFEVWPINVIVWEKNND